MRLRILTAALVLTTFLSAASAQSYNIRVDVNASLRSGPGLDYSLVESAPAGTVLQVIGQFNRWLEISRTGSQLWMADWVRHSRIEGAEQPVAQPSSDIDNCCFVDRQCHTDQEWTDGYWAFQNGQCGAPAQMQTQTSSQPVTVDAASANNCCQIGWQCHNDADWRTGYMAFGTNQCKHPGVAIEGSPAFIARIEETFDLLSARSPHWYNYTITGLDKIEETARTEGGARVWSADARTEVPTYWALEERSLEFLLTRMASTLAHEACHIHRHLSGQEPWGLIGETACIEVEITVLEVIAAPDNARLRWLREIRGNIHDPAYQWWH